jgi:hypothetical protein
LPKYSTSERFRISIVRIVVVVVVVDSASGVFGVFVNAHTGSSAFDADLLSSGEPLEALLVRDRCLDADLLSSKEPIPLILLVREGGVFVNTHTGSSVFEADLLSSKEPFEVPLGDRCLDADLLSSKEPIPLIFLVRDGGVFINAHTGSSVFEADLLSSKEPLEAPLGDRCLDADLLSRDCVRDRCPLFARDTISLISLEIGTLVEPRCPLVSLESRPSFDGIRLNSRRASIAFSKPAVKQFLSSTTSSATLLDTILSMPSVSLSLSTADCAFESDASESGDVIPLLNCDGEAPRTLTLPPPPPPLPPTTAASGSAMYDRLLLGFHSFTSFA